MITLQQVKLPISHTKEELEKKILKTLRIKKEELLGYEIRKQSLDARKKPELFFVYTIDASVKKEETVIKKIKENDDFVSQSVVNVYIYRVLKISDRMCFISKVLVE